MKTSTRPSAWQRTLVLCCITFHFITPLKVFSQDGSVGNPFTSLSQARNVTAAGMYSFNLAGNSFQTYVDLNGYVLIANEAGPNMTGVLPDDASLGIADRGILSTTILAALGNLKEVRIATSTGNVNVVTTDPAIIARVKAGQSIHRGINDNAINNSWTGTNASFMTADATCITSTANSLAANISHPCGATSTLHWTPVGGARSEQFSVGNITATFSLFVLADVNSAPGGLGANLQLWFEASLGTPCNTPACSIGSWREQSANFRLFTAAAGDEAAYQTNSVNFRPGIAFQTDDFLNINQQIYDPNTTHQIYAVVKTTNTASSNILWSETNAGGSGKTFNKDGTYSNNETGGSATGGSATTDPVLNTVSQDVLSVTTYRNGVQQSIANHNATSAAIVKSSVGGQDITDHDFEGDILEMIIYSGGQTAAQREKIESYLALKYGIHKSGDYVLGASDIRIWDATLNAAYDNDVFGIGQDDQSGLLVNKSNSANTGSGDGTGKPNMGNIVLSTLPASPLADEEFLVVGHNTNALSFSSTDLPASIAASYRRTLRVWKAQYTTDGQVRVEFDFSGTGVVTPSTSDLKMLVDIDDDGTFANAEIVDAVAVNGNVVTFDVNIPTIPPEVNASLFAFAAAQTALPVKFSGFTATPVSNGNQLQWKVEETFDVDKYQVEYSRNGVDFTTIATVPHQTGTKTYSYLHGITDAGTHYYRILGIDKNGQRTYSETKLVRITSVRTMTALPNPVKTQLQLKMELVKSTTASLRLITMDGKEVKRINTKLQRGAQTLNVDMTGLSKGIYQLQIILDDEIRSIKLMKE
jgi:hypothetical protein